MKESNPEVSRKRAVAALGLSLVCLGMLVAYVTVTNYLAALGCLIAFAVLVFYAAEAAKGV